MSLVYELLDKKNKIASSGRETRLPLPDRSLNVIPKKKSRSFSTPIIASLAFVVSAAALAGGWYLYESMRAIQMDYIALDANVVQVSQRVQTLSDETNALRLDFNNLAAKVSRNTGESEKMKLEMEHAKVEMNGIKKSLAWMLDRNKDLQEQVQALASQPKSSAVSSL